MHNQVALYKADVGIQKILQRERNGANPLILPLPLSRADFILVIISHKLCPTPISSFTLQLKVCFPRYPSFSKLFQFEI